jgi:hypothetical protein
VQAPTLLLSSVYGSGRRASEIFQTSIAVLK